MASLDRQKYLEILNSQGVSAALTVLHRDMAIVEYEAFEGDRRAESERLGVLTEMRDFSREIWQIALDKPEAR
jgi:hypothetical protein